MGPSSLHNARTPGLGLGLAFVPLAVAVLAYWPALDNGFSLDDYNWLERATAAEGIDGFRFLLEREPGQLLNPVPRAVLWGWVRAFGDWPLPFHLAVLLLHVVNVSLVGVLGSVTSGRWCGLLAALLFAPLPAFHEAVFWVAAFFHPLTTTLYLLALLGFLGAERAEDRAHRRRLGALFLLAFGLAVLTKALAFALVPALLLYLWLRRGSARARSRAALCLTALSFAGLVAAANLAAGVRDSYLIERGFYAVGSHWPSNLWAYFGRLGAPLPELTAEVSRSLILDDSLVRLSSHLGALGVTVVVALAVVRGSCMARWWAGQLLFCLAPVLPFVFEPVSRYLYLAAAPLCLLLADLVAPPLASLCGRADRRWALLPLGGALFALCAVCWAEIRLLDNRYEHREAAMSAWLEQVEDLLPPRGTAVLTLVGFPTLGIDPGIHFEAALRLRLRRPDLELRLVDDPVDLDPDRPGEVLWFDGTSFSRRPPPARPR